MSKSHYIDELFGLVQIEPLTGQETMDELLAMNRYVRFVELMRGLRLDPALVRSAFSRARRGGVDVDKKYGVYRKGGKQPHMFIKPKQFAKHLAEFEDMQVKTPYQKLPAELSEEDFLQLKGVYKLSEILRTGFIPLNRNRIFKARKEVPRTECGLWKEGGLVLCQFEVFLPWAVSQMRNIPIEKARKALAATQKRIAADRTGRGSRAR